MQSWKHQQKSNNELKSIMNFLTQNNHIAEGSDHQIIDYYLSKHLSLVNKHRIEEFNQLQNIKQQINIKFKQKRKVEEIKRKNTEYFESSEQQKLVMKSPYLKSINKTKSLYTQIDSCTSLINDLKNISNQKKRQIPELNLIRQNQQSQMPNIILPNLHSRRNQIGQQDYKYHNISTEGASDEFIKQSKKNRMILTNSLNHSDLQNYRNRYYDSNKFLLNPISTNNSLSKSIQFRSLQSSPIKIRSNLNYQYNSLSQHQTSPLPRRLKQLLNVDKQQSLTPSMMYSKPVRSQSKTKHQTIVLTSKQKQLAQLYKAKIKGSRFCNRIRDLKSKYN